MMKSNVLYCMVGAILTILLGVAVVLSIVTKSDVLTSISSIGSFLSGCAAVYAIFSVPNWIEKHKKEKLYDLYINALRLMNKIRSNFEKFTEHTAKIGSLLVLNNDPLFVNGGYTAKDIISLQLDLLVQAKEIELIQPECKLSNEVRNANLELNRIECHLEIIESISNKIIASEENHLLFMFDKFKQSVNRLHSIHGNIEAIIKKMQ